MYGREKAGALSEINISKSPHKASMRVLLQDVPCLCGTELFVDDDAMYCFGMCPGDSG